MAPFIARWPLFRLLPPSPIGVVSALVLLGVSSASVGAQEKPADTAPQEINPFNSPSPKGAAAAAVNRIDETPPSPVPGAANYGKPRAKPDPRLKYPGRAAKPAHPLPDLVAYPRAPLQL